MISRKILSVIGVLMLFLAVQAEDFWSFDSKGRLVVGDAVFFVDCLQKNNCFQGTKDYYTPGKVKVSGSTSSLESTIKLPDSDTAGKLLQDVTVKGNQLAAKYTLAFEPAAKFRSISLRVSFRAGDFLSKDLKIDGKPFVLRKTPVKGGRNVTVFSGKCKTLSLPMEKGDVVIDNLNWITIQDYRGIGMNRLDIMFPMKPNSGMLKGTGRVYDISFIPFREESIDLRKAANMGFADETARDGKGGWTDQGGLNDLRRFPVGKQLFNGIAFDVIDPAKNNGASAVMLKGSERAFFPESAAVSAEGNGGYLHLIHAAAFSNKDKKDYGTITIRFKDNSEQVITVDGSSVGDWWHPSALPNGKLAWSGVNRSEAVGVYHSVFPIDSKPFSQITFRSSGGSVWGIIAATVSSKALSNRMIPSIDRAGVEWKIIEYPLDVQANSVLDFSARLDAPAGKYGSAVVRNGKFEFEKRPGKPVRFFGTNLCSNANAMSKELSDQVSGRLAMFGFNLVRLHHHDGITVKNDRTNELHEGNMDRMDYWISALAKRGIYVTTDIFVSRTIGKGVLPEHPEKVPYYEITKGLILLYDSACNEYLTYMRNILTHRNPYTGFQWKDDPAIVSISLINENSINQIWNRSDILRKEVIRQFNADCAKRKISSKGGMSNPEFPRFVERLYLRRLAQFRAELDKIGCKKPITDQNFHRGLYLGMQRALYDYVDVHLYHDHPIRVAGGRARKFHQQSAVTGYIRTPGEVFPDRQLDKPFAISEVEYCTANDYRAESGALLGTYGALQDFDMLVQFTYAHRTSDLLKGAVVSSFDICNDPMRALTYRFAASQFLDGSFKTAEKSVAIAVSRDAKPVFSTPLNPTLRHIGMVCRMGSLVKDELTASNTPADLAAVIKTDLPAPANKTGKPLIHISAKDDTDALAALVKKGVLNPGCADLASGIIRSETGQLTANVKTGAFSGVSAKSEVVIVPAGTAVSGKRLKVSSGERSVIGIIAPDGSDLAAAKRLLLMHCTNISMQNRRFLDENRTMLADWGGYPMLVRNNTAGVELDLPGKWKVWAVDLSGKRLKEVPAKRKNGKLCLKLSIANKYGQVIAYDLEKTN